MPGYTSGVAGQGISVSVRGRAGRPIGRAIFGGLLLASVVCLPTCVRGAEASTDPSAVTPAGVTPAAEAPQAAELFAAIGRGAVEAKVVVRDQYNARVILRNKTGAPLTLRIPDTFAARPILAQQGFFGLTGPTAGRSQPQPQAVSGPFGSQSGNQGFNAGSGQGGRNGNFFGNGNVFNIPPESVRSIPVSCFCVELGKPNPRSIHPYELVKFEEVGGDPQLAAVFERYARGDLDQVAVQAAVWHLSDDESWDELGKLSRPIALNADEPVFTRRQLQLARELVAYAARQAAEHPARYAAVAATARSAGSLAKTPESPPASTGDAGRSTPSSAEKYRTIRGIHARR
jgi:hypothetical protein